ncbi:MAG: glycosyltransferase family 39 protein [Anaerolineae bacterium]|nr:glycosyltransferase family 39 protein [Anaerolineae bacterium]MDQ7035786.1 glycosyltransferase family 39 protein [Anaerolineae bacterium]
MMQARQDILYHRIVVILLGIFALLAVRINVGWYGHHDENGRWISTAIRNYALYGADELGYLITTTPGPANPATLRYYVNHPPLIVWTAWLSSEIFGYYESGMPYPDAWPKEISVRLVSIFATMISLSAFYVLCRRLLNPHLALLALIFYGFTPMIAYFGRMPNHEPLALPFIYLFITVFINWIRRFTIRRSIILAVLAVSAMWIAWASAFFFATLGLVALIYGKKKHRIAIIGVGIITLLSTVAIPLFYDIQRPGAITDLLNAFVFRTSNRTLGRGSASFTIRQFIVQLFVHMVSAMTLAVVVFGTWGLTIAIRRKKSLTRAVIIALLGAPTGYMLVFRNAFYVHDYYKIFYMPIFIIGTVLAVHQLWLASRRGLGRFARPLVVAILVWSSVLGIIWFVILHQVAKVPDFQEISAILPNYSQETDIILTNLADVHPSIDYYTYRTLVYGIAPQDAILQAETDTRSIKYLYCAINDDDRAVLDELLGQFPSEMITDECRLLVMN